MFGICLGCDGRNATRREGASRYFYVGRKQRRRGNKTHVPGGAQLREKKATIR